MQVSPLALQKPRDARHLLPWVDDSFMSNLCLACHYDQLPRDAYSQGRATFF
jgi:hypothetical protein